VRGSPESRLELDKGHIVQLEISHETPPNELVSRLSETLNRYHDDGSSSHELISTPSEMVTFLIDVRPGLSAGTSSPEPFSYPKTIYMDQFIEKNLDLANETRAEQRQAQKDIEILTAQKRNITRFEVGGYALFRTEALLPSRIKIRSKIFEVQSITTRR
jgi:hypothetical protein